MPFETVNGARLHYVDEGTNAESVLFSHGLLFSSAMFEAQISALRGRYRCIAYDHRGQGKSEVTESGYDIDSLTRDAESLIEKLDIAPCHFVGLSMGSFVGMRLGIRRPDLLRSLTLVETTADSESKLNILRYGLLNVIAGRFGLNAVAGRVMPIMFGQTFVNDDARAAERDRWRGDIIAGDRNGVNRAVTGVIQRRGVADDLARIAVPTLILVGDEDVATPPEKAKRMHAAIPGSELTVVRGAGHSSTIEQPGQVTAALNEFLAAARQTPIG